MTPQRIQRKRSKGWRMPEGVVYVGRPTRWGNPFRMGLVTPPVERYDPALVFVRDRDHAVRLYRRWLFGSANRVADLTPELAGKDLACWCPLGQPCHADVLLEIANRPSPPEPRYMETLDELERGGH